MNSKELEEILIPFIKAARHTRNFPNPKIAIGDLRSEAVQAESNAERILGTKKYQSICDKAFKN